MATSGGDVTWLELAVCRCGDDINKDPAPLMHKDHITQRHVGLQPRQRCMTQALVRMRFHYLSSQAGEPSRVRISP